MAVAEVLAQKSVSLSSAVDIDMRRIEVIEEENNPLVARGSVTAAGLLLQ